MEFIVGKWYKNPGCFKGSEITWAKFSNRSGSSFRYSEWICEGKYEIKQGYWHYRKEPYEPVNIEEIRKYLPFNHPDLQLKKENYKYLIPILKSHGIQ